MKNTRTLLAVVACCVLLCVKATTAVQAQSTRMARGADISWCTEMEADGRKFYNAEGTETELFALMKEIGMTAIRLRVWVNPQRFGYGAWCDKADLLAKARRAQAQGLDLMIDFHYSDCFADPGRQTMPLDWEGFSLDHLKLAIAAYTKDILHALKEEGITPRWVQVGNETNNGMIWDVGKIDWTKTGNARYLNYVALSNAAYDAIKEICPSASVIVHYAGASSAGDWDGWFFKDFKAAGGRFDMIGLSLYPDYNKWNSQAAGDVSNLNAELSVRKLAQLFGVPVIICETGFSSWDASRASQVMTDLITRLSNVPQCAGVFYWEPQVDGQWKPAYYDSQGWGAYRMGAFTPDGKPTAALDAFKEPDGISGIAAPTATDSQWYDLQGRPCSAPTKGTYIVKRNNESRKVTITK